MLEGPPDQELLDQASADLDHRDPYIQELALASLVRLQGRAVPRLLEVLEQGRSRARVNAAQALARIGDERALPAFRTGLSAPDPTFRRWCATGLGRMGDATVLDALQAHCFDPSFPVAVAAVGALGEIGGVDAVACLSALLPDPRAEPLRLEICIALGTEGGPAALERLRWALTEDDAEAREAAVAGLVKAHHAVAAPWLATALLRSLAELRELVSRETPVPGELEQRLRCDAEQVQLAEALARLAGAAEAGVLLSALERGVVKVKVAAASALVSIAQRDPRPELAVVLSGLGMQLPPSAFHPREVRAVFEEAISRITAALAPGRELPIPTQTREVPRDQLPRVS